MRMGVPENKKKDDPAADVDDINIETMAPYTEPQRLSRGFSAADCLIPLDEQQQQQHSENNIKSHRPGP